MFKFFRSVLQLVLLVFAISVVFQHVQQAWLSHPALGYFGAIRYEWHIARPPLLAALVVIAIVIVVEAIFVWVGKRESDRRIQEQKRESDRRLVILSAIAKKLGVDTNDSRKELPPTDCFDSVL